MTYATVCSGAEAFGKSFQAMGYECAFHSEIDTHASAVLRHHYPTIKNHGDFTKIPKDTYAPGFVQLLAGGTPCQSFSVAGLRKGMADPRGNLTLGFLGLAAQLKSQWILWENVPGVLSADGGRAFASFLGGLAQLGYGFAYRILDAQYFGVPQRRRRVFVVGYLGDWRPAAEVLFERHSLQGHPAPSREAGQGVAGTISSRTKAGGGLGTDFECAGGLVPYQSSGHGDYSEGVGTLRAKGGDASRGSETLITFDWNKSPSQSMHVDEAITGTLRSGHSDQPAIALSFKIGRGAKAGSIGAQEECAPTLGAAQSGTQQSPGILQGSAVRRLTPMECERLMGWEDDWTKVGIDTKGKRYHLKDSARYKICGNGWAKPVVEWIGRRILNVDKQYQP